MWYGPGSADPESGEVQVTVQSIERAFVLLDALATGEAGVTELSQRVDLPKSTVARLLQTLEGVGAVARGDNNYPVYALGPALRSLAGASGSAVDLAAHARPHLRALAQSVSEDAGLGIPDGYSVNYIAQVDADNTVQVRDWTGEQIPMHVVPSGLILMAHWPAEQLDRFLARPLERFTRNTVTDPGEIRQRLRDMRADGYVWVLEEFAEGISSVAAPVYRGKGRIVGAIHVHGPAYRFPPAGQEEAIAGEIRAAANAFSRQLA